MCRAGVDSLQPAGQYNPRSHSILSGEEGVEGWQEAVAAGLEGPWTKWVISACTASEALLTPGVGDYGM